MLQTDSNQLEAIVKAYHRKNLTDDTNHPQKYYRRRYKVNEIRNIAIYLVYLHSKVNGRKPTYRELAELFGIDYTTVARSIKSVRKKTELIADNYMMNYFYRPTKFTAAYHQILSTLIRIHHE